MDVRYKDIISRLPEALICHILSFLPTKEAVSTSLLSKQWRYLFALSTNLHFDDSMIDVCPEMSIQKIDDYYRMFMDFVDRVLRLQENSSINKFSLKCGHGVQGACVSRWVLNVLERGVSDLDLRVNGYLKDMMIGSVFVSNSLVRLRIDGVFAIIDVVHDVFLPKVKTLHLDKVRFGDGVNCTLFKLVSGCPVLEELVMIEVDWHDYLKRCVSSKTLKRLTLRCEDWDHNPNRVFFYTPNLVYFEYFDHVADKYEISNFDSLVESRVGLRMTRDQRMHLRYDDMVGNATDLLMRINNVQTLYLSDTTLTALTFCCEKIPAFKNLIHLTIKTHREAGWESLPTLLENSPKLETLVFEGLHHKNTFKCKDVDGCLCKSSEDLPTFLSSSPVKVIKILKFGEISFYSNETAKQWQMEQVKYFLEVMSNLEQLIVCYNTRIDEDLKCQLERLVFNRGASSKCNVQLVCDYIIRPIQRYPFVD